MSSFEGVEICRLYVVRDARFQCIRYDDSRFGLLDEQAMEVARLNTTAALVWFLCDGHTSIEGMVRTICAQFGQVLNQEHVRESVLADILDVIQWFEKRDLATLSYRPSRPSRTPNDRRDRATTSLQQPSNVLQPDRTAPGLLVATFPIDFEPDAGEESPKAKRLADYCLGLYADQPIPIFASSPGYRAANRPDPSVLSCRVEAGHIVLSAPASSDDPERRIIEQKQIVNAWRAQRSQFPGSMRCWVIRGDGAGSSTNPAYGPHVGICRKPDLRHVILVPGRNRDRFLGPELGVQMERMRELWTPWNEKTETAFWGGAATGGTRPNTYDALSRYRFLSHFHQHPSPRVIVHPVNYPQWAGEGLPAACGQFDRRDAFRSKCLVLLKGNDVASGLSWMFCGNSVVLMRPPVIEHIITFGMLPWVHYVPLEEDPADVLVKLDWVVKNERAAREVVDAAHRHLRWLTGRRYLWACNAVLKRLGDAGRESRPRPYSEMGDTPPRVPARRRIVFYGRYEDPAFRLGGDLIMDELNARGYQASKGDSVSVESIRNSIVIFARMVPGLGESGDLSASAGEQKLVDLLQDLGRRGNTIWFDVGDNADFSRTMNPARDLVDVFLFPTYAFARQFLSIADSEARCEVLHGFCDPRLIAVRNREAREAHLRPLHCGRATTAPKELNSRVTHIEPVTMTDIDSHIDRIARFNLHVDVTPDAYTNPNSCTRIYTAAACRANIIADQSARVLEVLPDKYPYLVESPKQLPEMIDYAAETFGGPIWNNALQIMGDVRRTYTFERYMTRFVDLLESV